MGELRSARDIAAAKLAGLKPLSPEERRRLEGEEWRALGRGMAGQFLAAGDPRLVERAPGKHAPEAVKAIRRAAVERLLEALGEGPGAPLERIEAGLKALAGEALPAFSLQLARFLVASKEIEAEVLAKVEKEAQAQLDEMGIGGSALAGVNARAFPGWQAALAEQAPRLKAELDLLVSLLDGKGD
jgi:hypothetical protein